MFESTLDSWVGAAGVFSVLSLVAGPVLVVVLLMLYWKRRGLPANAPLFSAIPLALTTVSIQLLAAALETNRLFQSGTYGSGDFLATADALIHSRQSLLWRVIECAACIVIVAVFQMTMRGPAKTVPSDVPPRPSISVPILAWLGAVTLGVGILVWMYSDALRFFALVIGPMDAMDAATVVEAKARLGDMGIGGVAHFLTSRVNIVGLSAILLTLVLLTIGWRFSSSGRPVRRLDNTASVILGLVVLTLCGISAAGMAREIALLRTLELSPSLRPKVQRIVPSQIQAATT